MQLRCIDGHMYWFEAIGVEGENRAAINGPSASIECAYLEY